MSLIDAIGDRACDLALYLVDVATIIGNGILFLLPWRRVKPVTRLVLVRQVLFTGVEAVPFVALLAGLTALSLVVQGQVQLQGFGQSDLFGKLLVVMLVRELGPLLIAMVVIARSGSAMATEMANMRVAGEIQALEWSGIDPFRYLVVPRLAGVCIALVCLVLLFIAISLTGGFLLSLVLVPNAPGLARFTALLANNLTPFDGVIILAKTVIPGLLITAIACLEGTRGPAIVTEVPRATTRGVVRAITAVFVWDALVTALAFI
ncbi:MAG: ABC transporter permease [Planctomycetes bacterium]|nr:ABC transporter permease [Planctomycetota bacterium]